MSRVKDLWIEEHERLIAEYLDAHPEADEEEAELAVTGEKVNDALADRWADMIDTARLYAKEKDL